MPRESERVQDRGVVPVGEWHTRCWKTQVTFQEATPNAWQHATQFPFAQRTKAFNRMRVPTRASWWRVHMVNKVIGASHRTYHGAIPSKTKPRRQVWNRCSPTSILACTDLRPTYHHDKASDAGHKTAHQTKTTARVMIDARPTIHVEMHGGNCAHGKCLHIKMIWSMPAATRGPQPTGPNASLKLLESISRHIFLLEALVRNGYGRVPNLSDAAPQDKKSHQLIEYSRLLAGSEYPCDVLLVAACRAPKQQKTAK